MRREVVESLRGTTTILGAISIGSSGCSDSIEGWWRSFLYRPVVGYRQPSGTISVNSLTKEVSCRLRCMTP